MLNFFLIVTFSPFSDRSECSQLSCGHAKTPFSCLAYSNLRLQSIFKAAVTISHSSQPTNQVPYNLSKPFLHS